MMIQNPQEFHACRLKSAKQSRRGGRKPALLQSGQAQRTKTSEFITQPQVTLPVAGPGATPGAGKCVAARHFLNQSPRRSIYKYTTGVVYRVINCDRSNPPTMAIPIGRRSSEPSPCCKA